MNRNVALSTLSFVSFIWKVLPSSLRAKLFFAMFVIETRGKSPDNALRRIFKIQDYLEIVINERALALGLGEHPKHELIPYHKFFVKHLEGSNKILDVGCGYGAVSRTVALSYPESFVLGIDNDESRLSQALSSNNPKNLSFLRVDLFSYIPPHNFEAVILSNVLEHVHNRVETLKRLVLVTGARIFLVRVPLYERHWSVPMRKS